MVVLASHICEAMQVDVTVADQENASGEYRGSSREGDDGGLGLISSAYRPNLSTYGKATPDQEIARNTWGATHAGLARSKRCEGICVFTSPAAPCGVRNPRSLLCVCPPDGLI